MYTIFLKCFEIQFIRILPTGKAEKFENYIHHYMRHFLLVFLIAFASITCYGQNKHKGGTKSSGKMFIDFGPKGMIGTGAFINSNVLADNNYNHNLALSYGFGGKLAIDFSESIALVAEGIYGNFGQKFKITDELTGESWEKSIKMTSIDMPFLFRHNKPETGSYIELGPQYSILSKTIETNKPASESDNTSVFKTNYWSAVFGFGGYIMGWENLGVSTGLRFVYTFQDIVNDGGTGNTLSYNDQMLSYETYKGTTPLAVFFVLEVNYDLGFILAKNGCTGRRKFMFYN